MSDDPFQRAIDAIDAAEARLRELMRSAMGSPSAQHERLEALIDTLDPRHATGIDRTTASWWRASKRP